jgi:hypothetical protein
MKKLFFSTVALVRFSSVSMGNTITQDEEKSSVKEEEKIVLVVIVSMQNLMNTVTQELRVFQ